MDSLGSLLLFSSVCRSVIFVGGGLKLRRDGGVRGDELFVSHLHPVRYGAVYRALDNLSNLEFHGNEKEESELPLLRMCTGP